MSNQCRRHKWVYPQAELGQTESYCILCGALRNDATSLRGKRNRNRGNAIEREVCKALGITRVGHHGGKPDGGAPDEPLLVTVKSGGSFSERYWKWLNELPQTGQTPLLVVTDAPGGGHKRRAMAITTLNHIVALTVRKED